ncbi:MAG: heme ABC exporter ATP-binding protein CcmA [Armatimonadota bacterium]|nr:heme ABC exporter ATP-binding protein CcmA [Armatimonadota bacterium]
MSGVAAIEVRGVTKSYDHRPVLRGADLSVPAGLTLAVLGANGSGKTTLLRVIATLSPPTRGSVVLFGRPASPHPQIRRRIGLVAHESLLYDNLTVTENLHFFAGLYGLGADRVAGVLAQAALEPLAHRRVRVLSRGQRQQVNLARAVLHNPDVLILDEPYTGLDVTASGRLTAVLREEAQRGRTIVFATHDLAEARDLHASITVLLGGRLTEIMPANSVDDARLAAWFHGSRW